MLSIGLMSGTSMDGIDAALIETDGKSQIKELGGVSLNYNADFKILLKSAELAVRTCNGNLEEAKRYYSQAIESYLTKELKSTDFARFKEFTFDQIVEQSTNLHAEITNSLLKKLNYNPKDIDIIGYHGQTLFHRPSEGITIQIGNGQLLAKKTNIKVINDFRSNDVKSGGQGAPFAPIYHLALAIRDNKYPIAIVNCGGIANVTFITGTTYNDIIGFDTGPGNGLIDRLVKQKTNNTEFMDQDGKYGKKGQINLEILKLLFQKGVLQQQKNYFDINPPKSLDIDDLKLIEELKDIPLPDACATLAAFTAESIAKSIDYLPKEVVPINWVLAGGGWNNPVIKDQLTISLQNKIKFTLNIKLADEINWNSKYMEAQIFAYLAVRSLLDLPISVPATTKVPKPLSGGRLYTPITF
jgi:anhydro-N-acetylmuramic acid kinase